MSYYCGICNNLNEASLICTVDNEKFCEKCLEFHMKNDQFDEHKIQPIEFYEEEKQKEEQRSIENSQKVSEALRDRILKEHGLLDSYVEEIKSLLVKKRDYLHQIIDNIIQKQIEECYEVRDSARVEMELLLKELSVDYSHNIEASDLVERFQTIEETHNLKFLEIRNATHNESLGKVLKQELNYALQYYPYGKPISLYYFKPVSDQLSLYNGASNSLNSIEIPSQVFKDYPAYCKLPDDTVLYSGGWQNNSSCSEVFLIDPRFREIEIKPSLKTARHQHSMIYYNGAIYVFGGATATGITNSSEKWIIGDSEWKPNGFMNKSKAQMGICELKGIIYISGEKEIESFNPATNEFKELPIVMEGRFLSVLVPRQNSILMFRGGDLREIEIEPRLIDFIVSPIRKTEWWCPTQPVWVGSQIFLFTDYSKTVYCYDMRDKKLYLANNLRQ
ncbi:unnamed protein product [Blepharisma stoltei]|uniref:B box-type domain-containing protein n=1 Tax=Blepharisma stoltei TaxID=1481888 RepID=A0AAU9JIW7_9CILI|nr:unnamed protein product [Blepharisma stoltei]